ncbi:MAG: hypothetical protein EOO95_09195 [Pedobacter sp.]|nr:MAG: hypothetical protein EOO95_09195 [Pedobacter sp.]
MKYNLVLFTLLPLFCFSQKVPVIKATSKAAIIREQGQPATKWTLSPETKPDVYTTGKIIKSAKVTFVTDIDSITLSLRSGEHKDFIVVNGKDSCYTRIQALPSKNFRSLNPPVHDTLAFNVNKFNTNYIQAILNRIDTLKMNFDTGATEMTLIERSLSKLKSKPELYNKLHDVQVGNRTYKTKLYDIKLAGDEVDGLIGWDNFDGMIVEMNYDNNIMVVHSKLPREVKNMRNAVKMNLKYFNHRFFIEAQIKQGDSKLKEWFLFDTGYQKTVMLDNELFKNKKFPADSLEVLGKVIMRWTLNNEIPVITAKLESLTIGKFELKDVPIQLMTTTKTQFGANVHILGNDVLKRFNTYLDFQENVVYLVPNSLFNMAYNEVKRG